MPFAAYFYFCRTIQIFNCQEAKSAKMITREIPFKMIHFVLLFFDGYYFNSCLLTASK